MIEISLNLTSDFCVMPRIPVRPDWRIRTEFGVRDHILKLFTCFFFVFCFQSRTCTCGYGPHLIIESKYQIHIQNNYHRSGVHKNLYTYTESHFHIQNCTFTFTNQSTESTCSEPLPVCWPSCMRMFSDVFSCTYTD